MSLISRQMFITFNRKEIPFTDAQFTTTTQDIPLTSNFNQELRRLRNTTIACELHPVEETYQPTGPVVEGSLVDEKE